MLKQVDKFIIRNFLGIFFLTFSVVIFILLVQVIVNYFKDLVGKDIGYTLFAELLAYFALALTPQALPLGVLLGTLIAFGNLGEHYELTALKSAGISLPRVLVPVGLFCLMLTAASYWFQEQVVPWANLQAYSLVYDLKQKKPTLDIKEGVFYNGIPDYSIKIKEKLEDGKSLKGIMIYNHTNRMGNKEVILAEAGKMYTILNDKYLVLELFNGNSYNDQQQYLDAANTSPDRFIRNNFKSSKLVFSLAAFDLSRTNQSLFLHNRQMKNISKLTKDLDSIRIKKITFEKTGFPTVQPYYLYYGKEWILSDSIKTHYKQINQKYIKKNATQELVKYIQTKKEIYEKNKNKPTENEPDLPPQKKAKITKQQAAATETATQPPNTQAVIMHQDIAINIEKNILDRAVQQARNVRIATQSRSQELSYLRTDLNEYNIQIHKRYTESLACFLMFLIGAPLGAIIKKGGLGMPVIISVAFFVVHYIFSMTGEKWAKENFVDIWIGTWTPSLILFGIGLFFLRQAKNDSRILETDLYAVWISTLLEKIKKKTTK